MSIRKKARAIVSILSLIAFIVLGIIIYFLVFKEHKSLEADLVSNNVERATNAYLNDLDHLSMITYDWAVLDDSYKFIQSRDVTFIQHNLNNDIFRTLGVNAIIFLDSSGSVVYSNAFDLVRDENVVVSSSLLELIRNDNNNFFNSTVSGKHDAGIIILPEGPMMLGYHPILPTDGEGPSKGTLIMGQFIDAGFIQELSDSTELDIDMFLVDSPSFSQAFNANEKLMGGETLALPLDSQTIEGFRILDDIFGKPALVLKIRMARDIYQQGIRSTFLFFGIILIFSAILIFTVSIIVDRNFLMKVVLLNKSLNDLSNDGNIHRRISIDNADEVSQIGQGINSLLDVLDENHAKLFASEEQNRLIIENINEIIFIIDREGKVEFINDVGVNIFGSSGEEIKGKPIQKFINNESLPDWSIMLKRIIETGEQVQFADCLLNNSHKKWLEICLYPFVLDNGTKKSIIGIARDVSAEKENLDRINQANDLLMATGKLAKVGGWELLLETQTLNWTPETYAIHEINPGDEVSVANAIDFYVPEARPVITTAVQACIESGTPYDLELELITATGRHIWIRTKGEAEWKEDRVIRIYGAIQDITEKKELEIELRNSNAFLMLTQKVANIAGWKYDDKNDIFTVSPEINETFEVYPDSDFNLINLLNSLSNEPRNQLIQELSNCGDNDNPINIDFTIPTENGHNYWVNLQGKSTLINNEKIIIGTVQDISKRKEIEEALQLNEEKFRSIVENSNDGIFETDFMGKIQFANRSLAQMLGYQDPKDILGKPFIDFIAPETTAIIQKLYESQLDGREKTDSPVIEAKRKDGSVLYVQILPVIMKVNGQVTGAQGTIHDLTDTVMKERLLSDSQERYKTISLLGSDYIFATQVDEQDNLHLNWVAGAFEKITGYSYEEYNECGGWRARLHPDDLVIDDRDLENLHNGVQITSELRCISKDGEIKWVEVHAQPIMDTASGKLVFIYGAVKDISSRKQAEETINKSFSRLETLNKSSIQLQQLISADKLSQKIIQILENVTNYEYAEVLLVDENSNSLIPFALSDQGKGPEFVKKDKNYVKNKNIKVGEGITGWVAENGKSLCIGDVRSDSRYYSMRKDILSELCVPLLINEKAIGVINVESEKLYAYNEDDQQLLETISSQIAIAIQNTQLYEEVENKINQLTAIYEIDRAINSSSDLQLLLETILDHVIKQLQVDAADILLINNYNQGLEYCAGRGFHSTPSQKIYERIGEGLAGRAVLESKILSETDTPFIKRTSSSRAKYLSDEGFVVHFAVPLVTKGDVIGVLEVFNRNSLVSDNKWISFLQTLAGQLSIALNNVNLIIDLKKTNFHLITAYNETIEGWSKAMDLRDKETEDHTLRVTEITLDIARFMGIDEDQMVNIWRGALLHDVGKLGVPDNILLKPGPLTDEEWVLMKQHPKLAFDLLYPITYLRPSIDIPYCHHEKWDGSGYPRGLKGKEIPLAARIFAVADVWDALTSDRPYRKGWSQARALKHIKELAGKHFDPDIVRVFIEIWEKRKNQ